MREIGIFRSPAFSVFCPLSPSATHLPTAPPGAHLLPTVCSPSFLLLRELCLLPHEGHWVSRRVRTSRTGSTSVGGVPGWPEKPGLCSQMVRVQSPALPLSGCVTLGESRLFGAWPPYCKMGRQCSPCTHIPKMSEAKYMSQHLAQCLADCRCWKSGPAYFLTSGTHDAVPSASETLGRAVHLRRSCLFTETRVRSASFVKPAQLLAARRLPARFAPAVSSARAPYVPVCCSGCSRMVRLCARSSSHGLGPRAPGQGPCLAHLSSTGPAARRFTEVCWTCGRSREVTIVHRSMFTWSFTQGIKAEAPVHRPVAARRTKGQYMP